MRFPKLEIGQNAYLMRDYEFKQVEVKEISEDGLAVKVKLSGFLSKKELVKRSELIGKADFDFIKNQRDSKTYGEFAGDAFESAVNTSAEAIDAAGEFAGKLKDTFNKFKDEVVTDELLERMKKDAEETFDPKVAKEKVDTCSEVLGDAVKNMHDKFFKNEKDN
jgi:hypothetical protein